MVQSKHTDWGGWESEGEAWRSAPAALRSAQLRPLSGAIALIVHLRACVHVHAHWSVESLDRKLLPAR